MSRIGLPLLFVRKEEGLQMDFKEKNMRMQSKRRINVMSDMDVMGRLFGE